MEFLNRIYCLTCFLFAINICSGSPTYDAEKANENVQGRLMDLGNGMLVPSANDLLQQAMAGNGVMMNHNLGQPTGPLIMQTSPAQMYQPTSYAEPFTDNSIFAHVSTVTRMVNNIISLITNSFGIVTSSFSLGDAPPTFIQLMVVKRDAQSLQDLYTRFISIIAKDLVGIDRILKFIPGYMLVKGIIGIPTFLIQKVIQGIQDMTRILGLI